MHQLLKNRGSRGKTTKLRCFLCVCPIYRHSMKGKRSSGNQGQTMKLHLFLACTLEKNTRDQGKNYKTTLFCVYALYIDTPCNGKYHQFLKTKLQNYSKFLYQLLKKQRAQGQNYKTTLFFVCMTYILGLSEIRLIL